MPKDPLAFLDVESEQAQSDPLSFLNETENSSDPLSFLDEPKKTGFLDKVSDYFSSGKFGEALSFQMQSGGPAGAPALSPEQAKKVGTEVATIAAVEGAFAPVLGAAIASKVAPRLLESVVRLTQAGTTGAAVATTSKLVEEGEFPTQEELLENGLQWMAIDGIMQGLHLAAAGGKKAYDFGKAVDKIAKEDKIPRVQVLKNLWDATKGYIRSKFGREIKTPDDITPQDVELLIDKTKEAEAKPSEMDIEIKPIESENTTEKSVSDIKEFITEKGSSYKVNQDGTTTRNKAKRAGDSEFGEQPVSEKTYYVSPEDANKLSEINQSNKEIPKSEKLPENKIQEIKRQDISKEGLKTQKQYILEKIYDALNNPQKYKGQEKILLDVPGDGQFKIHNNEKALNQFAKEVEKRWPDKPLRKLKLERTPKKIKKSKEEKPLKSELPKKPTQIPPEKTTRRQPKMGKEQAVARSKILKLFRKAFKDPIRLGKFKQRAAGIHKLWPRVTRLLKDNDVETAAHEIGHNLHTFLYGGDSKTPEDQIKNIETALKPYLVELKPLAFYEPWGMEGFAEFTRLYITNPDVALELAPKFYAKFEADLEAQYPELKNALLEARDYYDKYLHGTPQSRIRAQTNYVNDQGRLANIIDSVKKNLDLDNLKTQFLDDVFPAKRLVAEAFGIPLTEVENLKDERNLYRSLRLLKGAVGKGDVFVLHETFDAKTLDKINGSLKDILKQLPDEESYREFNDYLIARRTVEKSGQSIETGINIGDAIQVEQELRDKYGKLATELDRYNDSLLKYAKDSGLLSKEQYTEIKKNNVMYAPFQRVMEKEKGNVASGAGKLQAGKPIKRMKGSTRDIIAPLESILKNTYSIIINSEKNLSGQVLAKLAKMKGVGSYVEKVPTPIKLKGKIEGEIVEEKIASQLMKLGMTDLLEAKVINGKATIGLRKDIASAIPDAFLKFGAGSYPAGENIVTVYFDGKPNYYEVSPEIYEMWTKGIAPYTADILTKILRIPARSLRAGAILNPKFMEKNFIRDTWGNFLFTKYGKSIKDPAGLLIDTLYSPLAMLATSAKKAPLYVEWLKSGGGMSTMQSLDRDAVNKKLEEVRFGYQPHQIIKWLRLVAEISEESNRLAEFGKALQVEGNTRLGREIAAFAARDLSIDFAKIGLQTKALNQIIPFFNATIQGGDKLLRTLGNADDRKSFIPRIVGFIMIPSLILAWLNKDDEDVKEFYEEEKDFNFITKIGGKYLKIPVPFETGVLVHGLTQRLYNYFMKKDPEAFEKFMESILRAMLPNFLPAFANPIFETMANRSFFTGGRIIPAGKEDLISKYQYKNHTSATARLIGRGMTYMLGQETRSKAASPAVIDHFINSWGGGLGRLLLNISDASLEAAGLSDKIPGPSQTIIEKLGIDGFTARYPRSSTRSIEKFYDNYQDATARQKSFKYAEKMDLETEQTQEQAYHRFDKIYDYPTLQNAYKAMQSSQKEINNIWNDPSIDADLKRQMIDDLYFQQIEFAKAANEDIKKYRLAQD